jgi:2-methylcitrate dehydratase PrpD
MKAPRGSKEYPATRDELLDKFRTNASYSMIKTSKVEAVIEMIDHLDDLDVVGKLFELLRK